MKRFRVLCFLLLLSFPAAAVDDGNAVYVGGTAANMTAGVVGKLDTTSDAWLTFQSAGNRLTIPYASIESYEYSTEVTRHLGVMPAIAIGLVKMRRHSHFFRISYRGQDGGAAQVAVFEVPKHMPRVLKAILQTRAPQTCKPCNASRMHIAKPE